MTEEVALTELSIDVITSCDSEVHNGLQKGSRTTSENNHWPHLCTSACHCTIYSVFVVCLFVKFSENISLPGHIPSLAHRHCFPIFHTRGKILPIEDDSERTRDLSSI